MRIKTESNTRLGLQIREREERERESSEKLVFTICNFFSEYNVVDMKINFTYTLVTKV